MPPLSALELSSSHYATHRKEMLALLKQLRATGSQAELDLPRITVIGNQSAGKSSVVEAISGITVPRDAGTCTRCPMECRLSKTAGSWSCQISIRREYDASGNVLDKVTEETFGHIITDKKFVEPALRRAQIAVLNPHLGVPEVLRASVADLSGPRFVSSQTHKFSRDTICIDLEGPDLTDLSFVDLPGLIQNAEPQLVKLVEDMVISHIKGNCLILVALPMTDDIENQKALRLARQEDPDGRRTIGVMTKPDMLTAGQTKSREIWLDIIEGRRHPLVHGYYCTRQPDDAQRAADITQEQARAAETSFFASEAPWSKSTLKNRFGTVHLIASLSNLLIGIINETIPRIRAEAASKLEACKHELKALPKAIDEDPANYMLKLLTRFSDDVSRSVHDGLDNIQLVHHNRASFEEFKSVIRKTAPNFIPIEEGSREVPPKLDELATGRPIYLNQMRQHIERSITRELPGNTPFSAKVDLINKFQAGWESAVEVCFDAVRRHVQRMLDHHVEHNFHRYDHLKGHVRIFISEIVQKHFADCSKILQPVLQTETTPFTQNGHYLSESITKWLAIYKAERGKSEEPLRKKRRSEDSTSKASQPSKSTREYPSCGSGRTSWVTHLEAAAASKSPVIAPTAIPAEHTTATRAFQQGSGAFSFGASTSTGPLPFGVAPQTSSQPASKSLPFNASTSAAGTPLSVAATPLLSNGFAASQLPTNAFGPPKEVPAAFRMPQSATPAPTPSATPTPQRTTATTNGLDEADRQAQLNKVLAGLAALGYHGVTEADLPKMIPPDVYEREIQVMADVRGYFQIAYKRIIDVIPSLIDLLFVKAIANDMQAALITKLSLGTADAKERCAGYLAEDPMVVVKRKELTVRKERLEEVRQALHAFGLST